MNGGVNGTMEEPMETSPPNSPINVSEKVSPKKNDINTNHCDNSNNTEITNHIDSESSQDPLESHTDIAIEDGKDTEDTKPDKPSTDTLVKENLTVIENNCSNSNWSCSDSMTSSQAKSETTEQPTFENVVVKCKQKEPDKTNTTTTDVNMESEDEVDSEEDSSDDEEDSEDSNEPRDTVSINSDSENSRQSVRKNKNSDVILVENDNGRKSQNGNPEEVHEIVSDNDDCVVANEDKNKIQLRRSSRTVKRKVYADEVENGDYDDESDIEEVELEDPLNRSTKPIVINDTKALVEMASKQTKSNQGNQKKEPTVVIIDTNTIIGSKEPAKNSPNAGINSQMYQNIVSRGTSVTVCTKSTSSSPTPIPQSQPSILPSLTDDMFVVEAPSFIVPYVYEKPSVKPFREFVDVLGKELEEQRAKDEQERLEKETIEKKKKEEEKRERKERGEEVEESEEEIETAKDEVEEDEEEERKKKKAEKKERRRRRNEDDDASWDGESSSESDDDIISDEEKTVVIKDKVDSIEGIKEVTELTADKVGTGKPDNYFDCSLGKFFINIGLNLVQEYVQQDLLKQQNRKLYKEKKTGQKTKATENSIASLMKNLEFSKKTNLPFSFPQKKCEFCSFKTESKLVMNHHLETPHMKNNVYRCNFCEFEIRSPHDILYHMESQHNVRGKLERAPAYHQCANCPFEDNGKGKLARHLIPCAKKFKPEINLAPPTEWEPPAKIPKITRNRNNIMSNYQNAFTRAQIGNHLNRPTILPNVLGASGYRPRGRGPLSVPPRGTPVHGAPLVRGGVMVRHNTPVPVMMPSNYPVSNNGKNAAPPKSMHQPSISITPLPRAPAPTPTPPQAQNKGTFVICEICDGYIKDLEQLRNHMQWIHKVKIHPKMIYNRPPLNCQKCQFRFFTDQGLERHLLGSHGLVTSSMQEAANKGKDAGRCPVCGRVYQWKLLSHVGRDHNLTLKPAHLSYKCTVCTATFGMYKQFENHVYSAHSVVAKRVMDKNKTTAKAANDSLLKPLKINDEITIIPQPAKASPQTKDK